MNIKALAGMVVLLVIVAGGWWVYTRAPAPAAAPETHILQGTLTAAGDYHYSEESRCFSITADYPARTGLRATADTQARAYIETQLKAQIDQFKSDNDVSDRDPEQTRALGICTDRTFTLQMQYRAYTSTTTATVSYLYTVYADSLGAHPNTYYLTFVFDQNGKIVSIEDVVQSNDLSKLAAIVTANVTAQLKERLQTNDVSEAIFSEGLAPTDNNYSTFVIDGSDLLVEIPPYQVAAYAAGTFEVRIPLSNLR